MTFRNLAMINSIVLLLIFSQIDPWYSVLLTVAQTVFVPFTLHLVLRDHKINTPLFCFAIFSSVAIFTLQVTDQSVFDPILAMIYFGFTMAIALIGLRRFLHRGFEQLEEGLIDAGLIYLAIGGGWFFAFEVGIDTGFSSILTWLTAIHFHYSAFLLPIFVGFLGRLYKPKLYLIIGFLILVSPIIVALGITFSPIIEVLSVILYIIGIYGLIVLTYRTPFHVSLQKWLIRISFAAVGITILFSLLYAVGNSTKLFTVTIDFMLRFHGITNAVVFASIGIIGWYIFLPPTTYKKRSFPISSLRGGGTIGEDFFKGKEDNQHYQGLVDNMAVYEPTIDVATLSPTIKDFYENTNQYRLFAEVKWKGWFRPFAAIYRAISRTTRQLNLPLSSKRMEMTGDITSINDELDGRNETRAWLRKADGETVFVALYSYHQTDGKTYMNIALPLPGSTMVGVLHLKQKGSHLELSSKQASRTETDPGIYLAIREYLLKLPLEEDFQVKEIEHGVLQAQHHMKIFTFPFLTINYEIHHDTKMA
ncbi:YndJ family protein [Ornithinibacillus salinisoli]|uniref:YndJ family protein n=1 Tax=Ornithinibacillus salinisoli TaxID=1848459 RepID=A0ABW4VXA0_9BACI